MTTPRTPRTPLPTRPTPTAAKTTATPPPRFPAARLSWPCTDANSIDDRGFNQFSWEGLKQYAEENGKTYTYYTPIDQSTQSYLSAIEGAVNNGAKLVVTPGFLFGEAIYKAQTMYPDVHFVLVDSTPTLDDDTVIADNTCSIFFAESSPASWRAMLLSRKAIASSASSALWLFLLSFVTATASWTARNTLPRSSALRLAPLR